MYRIVLMYIESKKNSLPAIMIRNIPMYIGSTDGSIASPDVVKNHPYVYREHKDKISVIFVFMESSLCI